MFHKVLIANRGEIACRILRTLRRMGVGRVAVYSDADRHAPHVTLADEAVRLGPAPAAQSYLDVDKILAAARATGAEAIHPGYGFLSENAAFAEACEAAGLAFIGPTPAQMRDFGLKHVARERARALGVPLLPGTELLAGRRRGPARGAAARLPGDAQEHRGRRRHRHAPLRQRRASSTARFEAVEPLGRANFKHAGLYLEKLVVRARHIEVQIFGDGAGGVLALGERDCSLQRRNQKVIEETPAPDLPPGIGDALAGAAAALGRAARYRSAGTVEFVLDADAGTFYFLEVNTRLQVEHGVTEEVTGIDLVEWMVRLAAGELPPLDTLAPRLRGRGDRGAPLRRGSAARSSSRAPGLLTERASSRPTARASRPGSSAAPRSRRSTIRCSPRSSRAARRARRRGSGWRRRSTRRASTASRPTSPTCARCSPRPSSAPARVHTRFLDGLAYAPSTVEVLEPAARRPRCRTSPAASATGTSACRRRGRWTISSFRLANRLVGNPDGAAGARVHAGRADAALSPRGGDRARRRRHGRDARRRAGAALAGVRRSRPAACCACGACAGPGSRAYLAVRGGFDVPQLPRQPRHVHARAVRRPRRARAAHRATCCTSRGSADAATPTPTASRALPPALIPVLERPLGDRRAARPARRARLLHARATSRPSSPPSGTCTTTPAAPACA